MCYLHTRTHSERLAYYYTVFRKHVRLIWLLVLTKLRANEGAGTTKNPNRIPTIHTKPFEDRKLGADSVWHLQLHKHGAALRCGNDPGARFGRVCGEAGQCTTHSRTKDKPNDWLKLAPVQLDVLSVVEGVY